MKTLAIRLVVLLATLSTTHGYAAALCEGEWFDPINDLNWNNSFPITVGGVKTGGNSDPPLMSMPAVCSCPNPMTGTEVPGIGMTYWEPNYLVEIAKTPGCSTTMGGVELLSGYEHLTSEKTGGEAASPLRQVHWFNYPVFAVLNVISGLGCMNLSGFSLAELTEVDSTWGDDLWAASAMPEGTIFGNILGQLSCIPDAIASAVGFPLDLLYWCVGNQGVVYPLTGRSQNYIDPPSGNMHILGKYMQRKTRQIGLLATIGPWAECNSVYLPVWLKSQYRVNPVAPVPIKGSPIVFGETEFLWAMMPPSNTAKRRDNAFVIWVGKQCCFL